MNTTAHWKRTLRLQTPANTPEGQKRLPISRRGEYAAVARSVGKVFLGAPTVTLVTGSVDTELERCQCRRSGG